MSGSIEIIPLAVTKSKKYNFCEYAEIVTILIVRPAIL